MLSCEKVEKFQRSRMENKISDKEQEKFLKKPLENCFKEVIDEDIRCGFWIFKGKWMQKLANKKSLLAVQTLTSMIYTSSFYYYSGTLTTLEKHYKFSSTQSGYIGSVYDIAGTIVSLIVPYYCSKGHFPRWMGFAIFVMAISYAIYVLPYSLFGAGEDALSLTSEYGSVFNSNSTQELIFQEKMKELCYTNSKNFEQFM